MRLVISVVFRSEKDGGRHVDPVARAKDRPGPHYRPQFMIEGSEHRIDMEFIKDVTLVRGEQIITEVENVFDTQSLLECIVPGKKFAIYEGRKVVADGIVLEKK